MEKDVRKAGEKIETHSLQCSNRQSQSSKDWRERERGITVYIFTGIKIVLIYFNK